MASERKIEKLHAATIDSVERYLDQYHGGECDMRTLIRVVIEQLATRQAGWQPIETAPKDGSLILVCDAKSREVFKVVYWDDAPHTAKGYYWVVEDAGAYHERAFTHWKRLDHPGIPKQ